MGLAFCDSISDRDRMAVLPVSWRNRLARKCKMAGADVSGRKS